MGLGRLEGTRMAGLSLLRSRGWVRAVLTRKSICASVRCRSQSMRWGGDYARVRKSLSDGELNAFESKASALMMAGDLQSGPELTATCDSLEALVDELAAGTRNV